MKVLNLTRKFKYNSITLGDPNAGLGPDAVREFYAAQYPELLNATVEGPVTSNSVATYTFVRAAGSKGRASAQLPTTKEKLLAVVSGAGLQDFEREQTTAEKAFNKALFGMFSSSKKSAPLPIPSGAVGIWG